MYVHIILYKFIYLSINTCVCAYIDMYVCMTLYRYIYIHTGLDSLF